MASEKLWSQSFAKSEGILEAMVAEAIAEFRVVRRIPPKAFVPLIFID